MVKIFWAGDSTVKKNTILTYPQTGIGQALPLYLRDDVVIENYAQNGRSTKSFIDESGLAAIYDRITAGDFLLIQFGHNDAKKEDPDRFTEPFGEYQENLKRFINAANNKKAFPVLITPLERRLTPGSHGDYVLAMKQVAGREHVPLIDLTRMSGEELRAAGQTESESWFMNLVPGQYRNYPEGLTDNTHLQYSGAVIFAGCVAAGLKQLGGVYAQLLIEEHQ